ncbi:MAG: hypothetical protein FWG30_11845 [Eubacteriaceae bacterium]|jgi:hypothetical protein|nr:hypothetical protein [Eubacteriaceae bacterium]
MASLSVETAKLIDMLPIEEQRFAYEFVKKLVLAWDPDFTKVTPEEAKKLQKAEDSGFILDNDIDWDQIGT